MQQIVNLLYVQHLKSLHYPENTINLRYRPSFQDAYSIPHRNFINQKAVKPEHRSIELKPNKLTNQVDNIRSQSKQLKPLKLSKQEENLVKTYFKNYIPLQKNILELPPLQREVSSRGPTTRGGKSSLSTPHKEERKITTYEKKRQKVLKIRRNMRKFKAVYLAIVFSKKIKAAYQLANKRFIQLSNVSEILSKVIQQTIHKYYKSIMFGPLEQMGHIIIKKMNNISYKSKPDIVNNLLDISQCLKRSSLKKQLLQFLTLTTYEHTALPHDFFTQFQLLRLDLLPKKFRMFRIDENQIKMIVGIFLGLKLFNDRIISKPQTVGYIPLPKKIDKNGKKVIWAYSSYFYHAFTKMFEEIEIKNHDSISDLKRKGVVPLDLKEESDQFFNNVAITYEKQHKRILGNLSTWIHRIASQVIRQRNNQNQ